MINKQEFMEEIRHDMLREAYEESQQEKKMHGDFDYAFETLGGNELHEELRQLEAKLNAYGWNTDYSSLCNYMRDI